MIPNIQWIEDNFNNFNKQYFNGQLQVPKFSLECPSDMWGCYDADGTYVGRRVTKLNSPGTISLTGQYSRNERSIQNTLLHEMIHMYIITVKKKMTLTEHGQDFYNIAKKINADGWNISAINDMEDGDVLVQGEEVDDPQNGPQNTPQGQQQGQEQGQQPQPYDNQPFTNNEKDFMEQIQQMFADINDLKTRLSKLSQGNMISENVKKIIISEKQEKKLIKLLKESEIDPLTQAYNLPPDKRDGSYSTLLQIAKEMQAELQDLKDRVEKIKQQRGIKENKKKIANALNESDKEAEQMPVDKKMNKPYCIDPEKVLIVKKHLDNNFKKFDYTTLKGGKKNVIKIVGMMDGDNVLKYMYTDDLKEYLIDTFQKMFLDKMERELFLTKVMNAWLNNKIGVHGTLDSNFLM